MPNVQKKIQDADKIYNKIIKKMTEMDTLIDKFNAKAGDSVPPTMQKNLESYGAKINALMGDLDDHVSKLYGQFNVKASRVVDAMEDIDVENLSSANKIYLKLLQSKSDLDQLMQDFENAMSEALPEDAMRGLLLQSVKLDDTTDQYLRLVETLYSKEKTSGQETMMNLSASLRKVADKIAMDVESADQLGQIQNMLKQVKNIGSELGKPLVKDKDVQEHLSEAGVLMKQVQKHLSDAMAKY